MTENNILKKIIKLRKFIIKLNDNDFIKWYHNRIIYYDSSDLVKSAVGDSSS